MHFDDPETAIDLLKVMLIENAEARMSGQTMVLRAELYDALADALRRADPAYGESRLRKWHPDVLSGFTRESG